MSLSNIEIKAVVKELKVAEGSYFSKIQFIADHAYRLKFQKADVIIEPGNTLHLTTYKFEGRPPSPNLRFVRKVLKGTKLKKVFQKDNDRVVVFEFDNGYKIVVEMFGKTGNLVLVDHDGLTRYALEYRSWKGRDIKPKKPYLFPPSQEHVPGAGPVAEGLSKRLDQEFAKNFVVPEKKDNRLERLLKSQEKAIKGLELDIEANRRIGDWIYANLDKLRHRFEQVRVVKDKGEREKQAKKQFGKAAVVEGKDLFFDA